MGYNMFAYCSNNPVMGYDPSGWCSNCDKGLSGPCSDVLIIRSVPLLTIPEMNIDNIAHLNDLSKIGKTGQSVSMANSICMTHFTKSIALLDGGVFLGKVGVSTTKTYQDKEEGLLYSYSDHGNDSNKYGAGINVFDCVGIGVGVSSNINAYANVQITPWIHGEASVGLDGIGVSVGIDVGNNSYDFEIKGGWGFFLFAIFGAVTSNGSNAIPAF